LNTPSLNGKSILVTGATNGIGEVTARELARMGADVVIIGRSAERCQATMDGIQQALSAPNGHTPGKVSAITADLSDLQQVKQAAAEYQRRFDRLDVLVNNAGGFYWDRQLSPDGLELTFALNHLNYFVLTQELLPMLEASANGSNSRVVNVSSDAHESGKIDFDDLQGEQSYNGWRAYSNSKLANVLFTFELARRMEGKKVTANALHPGFVRTNFGKNNGLLFRMTMPIVQLFGIPVEEGARTNIYLASSPEVEGTSGEYFAKQQPRRASERAYDLETARRLWEVSAEIVEKEISNQR
jgi:NAD(P)-dependent dehydrogenase (short-subunit alcohol dehydrogenase family)